MLFHLQNNNSSIHFVQNESLKYVNWCTLCNQYLSVAISKLFRQKNKNDRKTLKVKIITFTPNNIIACFFFFAKYWTKPFRLCRIFTVLNWEKLNLLINYCPKYISGVNIWKLSMRNFWLVLLLIFKNQLFIDLLLSMYV